MEGGSDGLGAIMEAGLSSSMKGKQATYETRETIS